MRRFSTLTITVFGFLLSTSSADPNFVIAAEVNSTSTNSIIYHFTGGQ